MSGTVTIAMRAATYAVFGLAYAFAGLFVLWRFPAINPFIPNFKVAHSEIPGAAEGFARPGSFEVRRVFDSDRSSSARVCAYMQRRAKEGELSRNGQQVMPDTGQYEIGCAETSLVPGHNEHRRFWQLPLLPSGDYVYVSKYTFRNPIHEHDVWLPEIPIKLK